MVGRFLLYVGFLATIALAQSPQDCSAPPPPVSPKLCCPFMDQGAFPLVPTPAVGTPWRVAGCAAECLFSKLGLLLHNQHYTLVDFYALDSHGDFADGERYSHPGIAAVLRQRVQRGADFAEIQRRPAVIDGLDNRNPIAGFAMSCMHF
ncbi:hypothetical protein pipiens_005984 [Culex pipiens pipiens]|uniref:Uncharacterized protein n=1 Tax=Culex pipiens pipiens TaxID=38569 RepID=A0ABD1DSE0_CULPP